MSTKVDDTWIGIQQQVKDDFLNYVDKDEMVQLVKILDLDVQGFSRRMNKAPRLLLKQTLTKFLDNSINLQLFFKGLVQDSIEKMEEMDYDDFILTASLNTNLSNADKMVLFATLYPEKYADERSLFCDNIDSQKEVFHGFIKPSLGSLLKTYTEKYKDQLENDIKEFFDLHSEFKDDIADSVDLNEFFINEYEDLQKGLALQLFRDFELDDFELTENDKSLVYHLVVTESFYHAVKKFKDDKSKYEALISEKENIETKFDRIQKRNVTLSQQLKEREDKITELINQQNYEMESMKEENEQLTKKIIQIKKSYQEELENRKEIQFNVFYDEDHFLFLTTSETAYFEHVIPKEMIIHYTTKTSFSDQLKFLPEQKLLFIDANDMISKQQLKIQKYLTQKNYKYKFVSGSLEKMLRQIIFYLEGDFVYETNN